ncbi:E3 ubiquitin-protein ligase Mdm2-like isoform X2 [Hetaerina americana]|uniref:E3 ubiquitin-protein ligase Mdm2-like isoform X2 n=1 Tax=Hetaerina americana TaxID=62018 RepID=UPI003A7F1D21
MEQLRMCRRFSEAHCYGSSSNAVNAATRETGREEDTSDSPPSKRANMRITFVPEIVPLSGDESVHSMQGWETELCRDTSDTSSDTDGSSRTTGLTILNSAIEYEQLSLSEVENPFGSGTESSSDSSFEDKDCRVKVTEIVVKVDEKGEFGDESNPNQDTSDSDIPRTDYWTCLRCKCLNKPLPRYCSKCFQVRKNWFPERPHPLPKRKKKACKRVRNSPLNVLKDCGVGSSSDQDNESKGPADVPSTNKADVAEDAVNSEKCITCMEQSKNTVFVHGKSGHLCCCYKCAKRIWSQSGKCPVCSRRCNRVIKIFFA